MPNMRIETIDGTSPHLSEVMLLWRSSSATLGLFPEGAFKDYAARRNILVALEDGVCVGYVLFRNSKDRITVVHLCIDKLKTKNGIARQLITRLHSDTKEFRGIGLHCRRDYEASKVWPRLGFTARNEKLGRGKDQKELTYWWMDHGHPNLFSEADRKRTEAKLRVAIDHNVFLDLFNKSNPDSQALEADWLKETIEICLTNEVLNEIAHAPDSTTRTRQRAFASRFMQLDSVKTEFDKAHTALAPLFPAATRRSDESDIRHLARAVASAVTVFATRDEELLGKAEEVYDAHKLQIVHPSDLIVRLDEMQRASYYQPARLAGTALKIAPLTTETLGRTAAAFHGSTRRESKAQFQSSLRGILSSPRDRTCHIVRSATGELLAVFAFQQTESQVLSVPVLRVRPDMIGSTLAHHILQHALLSATKDSRAVVRITDGCLDDTVLKAIQRDGFVQSTSGWSKISLGVDCEKAGLEAALAQATSQVGAQGPAVNTEALKAALSSPDFKQLLELERTLWPGKILDAAIPTFIVPIRPTWAQHLFDQDLANEDLFGGELTLNREAVYYRAAKPSCGLAAPGRILWYVSNNKESDKSRHIRACSFLDEIAIDKPKVLYGRFQRLGIYKWDDVYRLAKRDINNKIMALRFSDTVLLKRPISLDALRKTMRATGKNPSLVSPFRIDANLFKSLLS